MPSRELLTTCPFPHQSESHPSRSSTVVNFFSKPSKNLAPCWSNPSSDCENRNVILSLFETMVILSSILKKCQKSTTLKIVRYQLISALFCVSAVCLE